jgi:hypothetical protein
MPHGSEKGVELMQLPDTALLNILQQLDGKSLNALSKTNKYFNIYMPVSGLKLTEHVARERVLAIHEGDFESARRFKHLNWRERLYLEENAGCGFDSTWCEASGLSIQDSSEEGGKYPVIRLLDMGPKLLLSNIDTGDQPILRWRLRVTGNTAVEFGVIPAELESNQNSLHKADAVKGDRSQRCTGFCSQITAGSHLPVKVPVVRGTMVDLVASRGLAQIVLFYPSDAQEIKWNRDGHPVPAPYQGPRVLRFELEFADTYDVKLAVTCWAKASFDVIHSSGTQHKESTIDMDLAVNGVQDVEMMELEPKKHVETSSTDSVAMERSQSAPEHIILESAGHLK